MLADEDSYVIEFLKANGKMVTKTEQVRLVGNSVCPGIAEALIRAALAMLPRSRRRPRNDNRAQLTMRLVA